MLSESEEYDSVVVKKEKISDDAQQPETKKRRGRPPLHRQPGDETVVHQTIRLDKDGNIVPKKPRKPRKKEEKGSRKPYRKRIPKVGGIQTVSNGDNVATIPIKSEFIREIKSESHQQHPMSSCASSDVPLIETFKTETKKNEDINTLLFSSLFNKRIISDMSVADESATYLFRKFDELIKNTDEDTSDAKLFRTMEEKFRVVYNKTKSIENVLGPFCINLMRGYMSSKMSPIPIQRPWDIRTEVMNNDDKTWSDLQHAINEYCIHIQRQKESEVVTDEELLSQKSSSFFTGRSINNDRVPQYLHNSDWLIAATESRGAVEPIITGGGDIDSSNHRTHTVHTIISSFRGDLNHGIELPDMPLAASKTMELDKQETNMNSQKSLPVSDPSVFV